MSAELAGDEEGAPEIPPTSGAPEGQFIRNTIQSRPRPDWDPIILSGCPARKRGLTFIFGEKLLWCIHWSSVVPFCAAAGQISGYLYGFGLTVPKNAGAGENYMNGGVQTVSL